MAAARAVELPNDICPGEFRLNESRFSIMKIVATAKTHVAPVLHNAIGQLIAIGMLALLTSGVVVSIAKKLNVAPSSIVAVPLWLIVFLAILWFLLVARNQIRSRITIHSAQYGMGSAQIDVTDRLRSRITNGVLNILVTNETMGRDPFEKATKVLTITYRLYGRDRTLQVIEGSRLVLP